MESWGAGRGLTVTSLEGMAFRVEDVVTKADMFWVVKYR